jgi:mannose-6-phosphate isomerase-like protein (cupin superfamily)
MESATRCDAVSHRIGEARRLKEKKSEKSIVSYGLVVVRILAQLSAQESPFPKGKVATVDNHTGTVWLSELSKADDVFDFNVAHATFAPGAKLDWHIHPGGQILLITEGTGYYQEKDKPVSGELLFRPSFLRIPVLLRFCDTRSSRSSHPLYIGC